MSYGRHTAFPEGPRSGQLQSVGMVPENQAGRYTVG